MCIRDRTYYGHCSSVLVSAGDKVYQGQPIAKVGSTGRSTGNHCHFEVKINGTSVNPLSYCLLYTSARRSRRQAFCVKSAKP